MSYLRRADTRGVADFGWLQSRHSFSFGSWYDPRYMGESELRVINDDLVEPGAGFPTHGHRDMEILSYVLQGRIEHKDSMGHVKRIDAGEFQLMSAGTGVTHSEYNASKTDALRFLQIWVQPAQRGLPPKYQQRVFSVDSADKGQRLVVSADGRDDSLQIRQDVDIWLLRPAAGQELLHARPSQRVLYLQLIEGEIEIAGERLQPGDAYFVDDQSALQMQVISDAHALLFDLPA